MRDSTILLQELREVDSAQNMTYGYTFAADVVSLYDNIDRNQVKHALETAIAECREWSLGFTTWLIDCVMLSLNSAAGYFCGCWYKARHGIPTGGACCVHVANITVYLALRTVVYSKKHISLMYFVRFVDDGTGGGRVQR